MCGMPQRMRGDGGYEVTGRQQRLGLEGQLCAPVLGSPMGSSHSTEHTCAGCELLSGLEPGGRSVQ